MTDPSLGLRLRELLLRPGQAPAAFDGRRLQGLVGDLCGPDQRDLLPALRYLVLSPPFLSALRSKPPLADPQLGERLRQELRQVFAPALCERMEPVLQGLLDRPEAPTAPAQPAPMPVPASAAPVRAGAAPPATAEAVVERRGGAPASLVALLAFLSGGLAVALMVSLGGVNGGRGSAPASPEASGPQQTAPPSLMPTPAAPATPPLATPEPPVLPPPPEATQPAAPADESSAAPGTQSGSDAAVAGAVATVQALYASLSSGDTSAALQRLDGSAADQFDAGFFRQFREVQVADLQATRTEGTVVMLEGVVTFVYPDGSRQRESRSFRVDTGRTPARITESAFGRVLSPRR